MMWFAFISLFVIPCVAVNLAAWGTKIKAFIHPTTWHTIQMKPIDCAYCLSFWINIIYHNCKTPLAWYEILIFALASSVIAKHIENRL